jgi:hypothetical protein
MQSNFGQSCKIARAALPISAAPIVRIRAGAAQALATKRNARTVLRLLVSTLSFALIAATAIVERDSFSPFGEPVVLRFPNHGSFRPVENPTATDLLHAAARANFAVQFPTGLPANTRISELVCVGTSVIILGYELSKASRRSDDQFSIVLAKSDAVADPDSKNMAGRPSGASDAVVGVNGRERWRVGDEIVIVLRGGNIRADEITHIRKSMLAHVRKISNDRARSVSSRSERVLW